MSPVSFILFNVARLRARSHEWWYWWAKGWPFKSRCPQCAGSGKYSSESMARYGDTPHPCDCCQGTGLVPRKS